MAHRHNLCGRRALLCPRDDNRFSISYQQLFSPANLLHAVLVLCLARCRHNLPGGGCKLADEICGCTDLFSFSCASFCVNLIFKPNCRLGSNRCLMAADQLYCPCCSFGFSQPKNSRGGTARPHLHDHRRDGFGHPAHCDRDGFRINFYHWLPPVWRYRLLFASMDRELV